MSHWFSFKERHNYEDPVTDFLTCLYIKYDFDEAQKKLRKCEDVSYFFKCFVDLLSWNKDSRHKNAILWWFQVLSNDFFLTACLEDFRESARLLIFEMFCRIHQCISIQMLAERLNMQQVCVHPWFWNFFHKLNCLQSGTV